jgi:hypothetical protein
MSNNYTIMANWRRRINGGRQPAAQAKELRAGGLQPMLSARNPSARELLRNVQGDGALA